MKKIHRDELSKTTYFENQNGDYFFQLDSEELESWRFEEHIVFDLATESQKEKLVSLNDDELHRVYSSIELDLPENGFDYQKSIKKVLG
jgi:hypothetical protein